MFQRIALMATLAAFGITLATPARADRECFSEPCAVEEEPAAAEQPPASGAQQSSQASGQGSPQDNAQDNAEASRASPEQNAEREPEPQSNGQPQRSAREADLEAPAEQQASQPSNILSLPERAEGSSAGASARPPSGAPAALQPVERSRSAAPVVVEEHPRYPRSPTTAMTPSPQPTPGAAPRFHVEQTPRYSVDAGPPRVRQEEASQAKVRQDPIRSAPVQSSGKQLQQLPRSATTAREVRHVPAARPPLPIGVRAPERVAAPAPVYVGTVEPQQIVQQRPVYSDADRGPRRMVNQRPTYSDPMEAPHRIVNQGPTLSGPGLAGGVPRPVRIIDQGPSRSGLGIVMTHPPAVYGGDVVIVDGYTDPNWRLCQTDPRVRRKNMHCGPYSYHPYGPVGYRPMGVYHTHGAPGVIYSAPDSRIITIEDRD